tara:strand:+ start:57115 stop:57237 length:123 start_codon:yes stop_codon:yes gene_type:complete
MLAAVLEVDVFFTDMYLEMWSEIDQFFKWLKFSWKVFKGL